MDAEGLLLSCRVATLVLELPHFDGKLIPGSASCLETMIEFYASH